MTVLPLKPKEIECLHMLLAEPVAFQLTDLEIRSCQLVLKEAGGGIPAAVDHHAIVRHLIDATGCL